MVVNALKFCNQFIKSQKQFIFMIIIDPYLYRLKTYITH